MIPSTSDVARMSTEGHEKFKTQLENIVKGEWFQVLIAFEAMLMQS